jgi:hypothetical protein
MFIAIIMLEHVNKKRKNVNFFNVTAGGTDVEKCSLTV